jgi:peroxiredoxin
MEEHFRTYKHHNHHSYYNITYHQRFIYNSNINFMILSQFEKALMEDYSCTYIH